MRVLLQSRRELLILLSDLVGLPLLPFVFAVFFLTAVVMLVATTLEVEIFASRPAFACRMLVPNGKRHELLRFASGRGIDVRNGMESFAGGTTQTCEGCPVVQRVRLG